MATKSFLQDANLNSSFSKKSTDRLNMCINAYNFLGGVSVTSIKKEVKVRYDPELKMLLDVDFYYHNMLEYGMPIMYQDVLVANRVRDTDTLMAGITDEEIEEEFQYCFKKYGISR